MSDESELSDQPSGSSVRILYSDDDVRLLEEADGVYTVEYISNPESRYSFKCKSCALKMTWAAVAVFSGGPCKCLMPMRLESAEVIAQAAGGLN
jgi:hypothetical protein